MESSAADEGRSTLGIRVLIGIVLLVGVAVVVRYLLRERNAEPTPTGEHVSLTEYED